MTHALSYRVDQFSMHLLYIHFLTRQFWPSKVQKLGHFLTFEGQNCRFAVIYVHTLGYEAETMRCVFLCTYTAQHNQGKGWNLINYVQSDKLGVEMLFAWHNDVQYKRLRR